MVNTNVNSQLEECRGEPSTISALLVGLGPQATPASYIKNTLLLEQPAVLSRDSSR